MKVSVIVPCLVPSAAVLTALEGLTAARNVVEVVVVLPRRRPLPGSRGDVRFVSAALGRASQMNAGASVARGDTFLFLHADCSLRPEDVDLLCAYAARTPGTAVAGRLTFSSKRRIYRALEWMARVRDRIVPDPLGDQGLLIPRDLFVGAGGFEDEPLFEDAAMTDTLRARRALRVAPVSVVTSAVRFERRGVLRTLLENAFLLFAFRVGVSPRRLVGRYYGSDYTARWAASDPDHRSDRAPLFARYPIDLHATRRRDVDNAT